jgi:hypothetical protein
MSLSTSSVRARMGRRSFTQWFCLLAGALLLVRGLTVLPGASFDTPGEGWHAMFHLVSGVALLIAGRTPSLAYSAVAVFAFVYGVVAIAGSLDGHDAFGVIPIDTRDNVIHSAYVAVALGMLTTERLRRTEDRRLLMG